MGSSFNDDQSVSWRRNLYTIAAAEFIALLGFSLFTPFMPLFLQNLGKFSSNQAAFWAGIATGGAGLAMFLTAPIWGILADRWGRKPMLLRAQLGGAILVAFFILAPNAYVLVGLRMLQGVLTGTVSAASALVATTTPRDKLPYSMGILLGAVFSGLTLGPLFGGFMADTFGFHTTFAVTSGLLLIGGLVTLFLAKENFKRPKPEQRTSLSDMLRLARSRKVFPLLLVIAALNLGPQTVAPILPLIIGQASSTNEAATQAGLALALTGIITAISSLVVGRLNGRISIRKILIVSCIGNGLLYLPPIWANTPAQLIIFIGITGIFAGGIITSSNSLVGMSVSMSMQGLAYGLSQSANSLGSGLGPFIGGTLAPIIGLRYVFAVTSGIFLLVGLLSMKMLPRQPVPVASREIA